MVRRKTLKEMLHEESRQTRAMLAASKFEVAVVRVLEPRIPEALVGTSPHGRTLAARRWLDSALKRPWFHRIVWEDGPAGRMTPQAAAEMILDMVYGHWQGPHPSQRRAMARQSRADASRRVRRA